MGMKITVNQLRKLIKEVVKKVILNEGELSPKDMARSIVDFYVKERSGIGRADFIVQNRAKIKEMVQSAHENVLEVLKKHYPDPKWPNTLLSVLQTDPETAKERFKGKASSVLYVIAKAILGEEV